ncbi:MAG: CDP-alcohol phosphatidyltransferase family protein [Flavobacteriales bacterium]|nr:CDP-alcohol phosphatidyltransferase family protein [Flavobacteriales bacterium]MCB9449005.1 CDP-alcohol phosphatidyltransferase family protein [Flavobacteriales bacterium]
MTNKEPVLTLPNVLSSLRLMAFPVLMYLAFSGMERWFAIVFCSGLVTDILDGWIARTFNMRTSLGAKLDSLADIGMYIAAFTGVYLFKWETLGTHKPMLVLYLILYVGSQAISFIRFGKHPTLHLYSFKIGGYLQGILFFTWFASGLYVWYYYVALSWGVLACVEEAVVLIWLPAYRSDVKGLYWLMKEKK